MRWRSVKFEQNVMVIAQTEVKVNDTYICWLLSRRVSGNICCWLLFEWKNSSSHFVRFVIQAAKVQEILS